MAAQTPFRTFVLGLGDVAVMDALLTMFGEAFDEADTYGGARPGGPAIALYSKLGTREAVLHFDIAVRQRAKKIRATVAGRAHFRPLKS